jgi:small basic protein
MRPRLAASIGDLGDNVTDVIRAIVLGEAIALGLVTDETIINAYSSYVAAMLSAYGGAEAILEVLQGNIGGLQTYLVNQYYVAKQAILSADTAETVSAVDID